MARFDPRACQTILATPDAKLCEDIKKVNEICGGDCRRLLKTP
jgi:hypothetical protein